MLLLEAANVGESDVNGAVIKRYDHEPYGTVVRNHVVEADQAGGVILMETWKGLSGGRVVPRDLSRHLPGLVNSPHQNWTAE